MYFPRYTSPFNSVSPFVDLSIQPYQLGLANSFRAYLLVIAISTFSRLDSLQVGSFLFHLLILYYLSYLTILVTL